jgi:predicted nucleic acid-binding protein
VLIALLDADPSLHARATDWFADNAKNGWSSCPITQNGSVHIMSHPGYPNTVPASAVMQRLGKCDASLQVTPF